MKNNLLKFSILFVLIFVISCKKDIDANTDNKTFKIRYEITTTQNMVTSHSTLGKLDAYIGYVKDQNGNSQNDEIISGKSWVKEIVMEKPEQSIIFGVGGNIYLSNSSGSATARVYVNDKLQVEIIQSATAMPVNNLSLVIIGAQYNFVKK